MSGSESLAARLVEQLNAMGLCCATAESCTGGLVSAAITAVPGASAVFLGGAVTYTNRMKQQLLGVSEQTLEQYSAVSRQTATEMAAGVRRITGADIGVSVTGNAGPQPSEGKPVGLVWLAVDSDRYREQLELRLPCQAGREVIRTAAVEQALRLVLRAAQELSLEFPGKE